MSCFKFRILSVIVNCVTRSLIHYKIAVKVSVFVSIVSVVIVVTVVIVIVVVVFIVKSKSVNDWLTGDSISDKNTSMYIVHGEKSKFVQMDVFVAAAFVPLWSNSTNTSPAQYKSNFKFGEVQNITNFLAQCLNVIVLSHVVLLFCICINVFTSDWSNVQ